MDVFVVISSILLVFAALVPIGQKVNAISPYDSGYNQFRSFVNAYSAQVLLHSITSIYSVCV
jgi:hypothetical protein